MAWRIENRAGDGTPDVAWAVAGRSGWVELKATRWPARATTPVTIPSLTVAQVQRGIEWSRAGGDWALLVRFPDAWWAWDAIGAASILARKWTAAQARSSAVVGHPLLAYCHIRAK